MADEVIATHTGDKLRVRWCELPIAGDKPYGILVPLDDRDEIAAALRAGTYAFPQHYPLLRQVVPAESRVLDLGAHLGTFTVLAAAQGHSVLAVEASPRNAALLVATLERNGIRNATVVLSVVGDSGDSFPFVESGPHGYVARGSAPLVVPTVDVRGIRVDDLLARRGWHQVGFVKMDIEGSEVAAIEGMPRLLGAPEAPAVLFESNGHNLRFYGLAPGDLRSRLERYGYRCYHVRPRQLIRTAADELQMECVVDFLALKRVPPDLGEWSVSDGLTPETRTWLTLVSCSHRDPVHRAHVGRTLENADQAVLRDFRIAMALNALKTDSDPEVRRSVEWWRHDRLVPIRAVEQLPRIAWRRGTHLAARIWSRVARWAAV